MKIHAFMNNCHFIVGSRTHLQLRLAILSFALIAGFKLSVVFAQTPVVGIPHYVNGPSSGSNQPGFVAVSYMPNSGSSSLSSGASAVNTLATFGQIGSSWGGVYDSRFNTFYSAAALKRHSGYGPNGSGAIYTISGNAASPSVSLLIDLDGLSGPLPSGSSTTINTGAASDHGDLGSLNTPGNDNPAFGLAGMNSLGDIELSPNKTKLYVINAAGRELIEINITNPATPSITKVYPITSTTTGVSAEDGELRPWGLEIGNDGSIYVGVVATAENVTPLTPTTSGPINLSSTTSRESIANRGKLKGYVFKLNTTTGNFSQSVVIDLNYLRGNPGVGSVNTAEWVPWYNDYTNGFPNIGDGYFQIYPQPIVADMEIVDDGSMLISLMDRFGLQTGSEGNSKPGTNGFDERGRTTGDIVKVAATGSTWSSTINTNYGDIMSNLENEAAVGGIAYKSGTNEFIGVAVDPVSASSNGLSVIALNGSALIDNQDIVAFNGGAGVITNQLIASKGLALGDVEIGFAGAAPCSLADITISNPGACNSNGTNGNSSDDYFTADITVTFYTAPSTGTLDLTGDVLSGGGAISVPVATAGVGPTYTFTGVRLKADGTASAVTAAFSADPACTFSITDGPNVPSCSTSPACAINVTSATPTACANAVYDVAVVVTYSNSPGGNITVNTSNGGTMTVAATTSPQTITLTGLTANGAANIGVTAFFVSTPTCTHTLANAYNAPAACCPGPQSICPGESYTLTAQAGLTGYQWYLNGTMIDGANNQTYVSSTVGTYTYTALDGNSCPVTLCCPIVLTVCPCVQPTANFVPIPAKCLNLVPQDDGRIVLTAFTNADRFGVNLGNTYSGPAYAAATIITGIDQDLQTGIPNVGGGTYTVRIFNGSNTCFRDYVITVPPGFPCKTDPMGFIYCEESGKIIAGGTITVIPPAGATYVITQNGSTGVYQFFTDAFVPGIYTMTYTPPVGYMTSTNRLPGPTLDPTGQPNPYILGSGSASGTVLDNFTAAANPFYMVFNFESGDPEVFNNNIPLKGCCVAPVLTVQNGAVCAGDVINLTSRVTGNTPTGILTFHLTQADALAGTNTLVNTVVAPAATTTYYVRSTTTGADGTCSDVAPIQIAVINPPAALATANGSVCTGGSIDLSTFVTNTGGGSLSFYTTQANAQTGTNPLGSSTVSPASATNYYVRSAITSSNTTCFSTKETTVTIKPLECGVITVTGPN